MATNLDKRSGQSGSAAGADTGNPGAGGSDKPLSAESLATALSGGFEGNDPATQAQDQPGGEPGGEAADGASGAEPQNEDAQGQEGQEGQGEGADGAGEGAEGAAAEGAAEGGEGGEGDGAEPQGVAKRISKLAAKNRELELQLAEMRGQLQASPGRKVEDLPLGNVSDVRELERRANQAEAGLEEVDGLLAQLPVAPGRVEKHLREMGIVLKDGQGNEDFSSERIVDALTSAKRGFKETLKAVPQRKAWLDAYAKNRSGMVRIRPWLADRTDERHAAMEGVASEFPGLKQLPNWEYVAVALMEGHRLLQQDILKLTSKNNGGGGKVAPRGTPAGGGAARVQPGGQTAKLSTARGKFTKDPSKSSLAEMIEQSGSFVGIT